MLLGKKNNADTKTPSGKKTSPRVFLDTEWTLFSRLKYFVSDNIIIKRLLIINISNLVKKIGVKYIIIPDKICDILRVISIFILYFIAKISVNVNIDINKNNTNIILIIL